MLLKRAGGGGAVLLMRKLRRMEMESPAERSGG